MNFPLLVLIMVGVLLKLLDSVIVFFALRDKALGRDSTRNHRISK